MIKVSDSTGSIAKPYCLVKNVLDFLMASIMLIVLSPLLVLIAILIRLDSRGPALYQQVRVGTFGKLFTIYKFRTMEVGAPVLSTEDMQYQKVIPITRVGALLRKTSLDELPQLINIIKGEMSFIGPRPSLPTQTDVNELRVQMNAQCARPGITGLAQVAGRDELDAPTKVGYDAEYCRNLSMGFDIKILIRTFVVVVSGRGNK